MSRTNHSFKPRQYLAGVFRYSVAEFLGALIVLIFAAPFMQMFANGKLIESGLLTLVLISGVLAVGRKRRLLIIAGLFMAPAVVGKWLNHFWPDTVSPVLFLVSVMVFVVFMIVQLLRFILRAPRVDAEVLCGGIASYLLIGLLWAFAYMLVAWLVPRAFFFDGRIESAPEMTSFTSVYFSFITLTTVGYGDITPVAPMARMLALLEAMTGTLFVAILISRLVSLYARAPIAEPEEKK